MNWLAELETLQRFRVFNRQHLNVFKVCSMCLNVYECVCVASCDIKPLMIDITFNCLTPRLNVIAQSDSLFACNRRYAFACRQYR